MVKKNIHLYDSINMDAISCFDLEAKLERERLNSPRFWRLYYTIQEMLAKYFLFLYNNSGARQQSTLPPKLNKEAMEIATKIYYSEVNSIKPEDIGDLIALKSNKKDYHSQLNKLEKDMRAFIYDEIEADFYYLVFDTNSGIVIGGFTTSYNGNLNGLFSLVKGQGKKIFKLRLQYALGDILTIFCIGDKLRSLYESFNFKVENTIEWDDKLAPKNWNYDRFGRPDLYIMRRLNER